jgi:deoxyribose-phosphate aldolase
MEKVTSRDIAKMIDVSLVNPIMTEKDIIEGCEMAKKYDVASVCVKNSFVETAYKALKDTDVKVTTVISCPWGSCLTEVKVFETERAFAQGCVEVDMVQDFGHLLGGDFDYVERDIKAVADAAHKAGGILKVILENAVLTDELKVKACKICERAGADFVKTSTGYADGGATIPDLRLMRASVSGKVNVKAAGGVRSLDAALNVRAIGCARFGCTATVKIMEEAYKREAAGTLRLPEKVGDDLQGIY